MATQPPPNLPLFYKDLIPLSSQAHAGYHARPSDKAPFFGEAHAVPVTVDEFILAQRFYPIVFATGPDPAPLALFGLNEGVNVFTDAEGRLTEQPMYVPAYVRRYPFMLARLQPDAQDLSLCFDPTCDLIGPFDEGNPLFDGDKPSEATNAVLKFCEDFEVAGQRTQFFVKEVIEAGILMDGEVSIQPPGADQPYIYRGFQMVDEKKLADLRGDQLRKLSQNGALPLIYAHLFSLNHISDIFGRMMQQGKIPVQQQAPTVSFNPVN